MTDRTDGRAASSVRVTPTLSRRRLVSLGLAGAAALGTIALTGCQSAEDAQKAATQASGGSAASTGAAPSAAAKSAPASSHADSSATSGAKVPVPDDAPWKGRGDARASVNLGATTGMTGVANQFALQNGWYDDAGLDVTELSTTNIVSTFASGGVDVSDGDPGTYIPAIVNDVPFTIVGNMWRSKGAYWIIGDKSVATWDDVKGKKFGTAQAAGGMKMTALATLAANGVDVERDGVDLVANNTRQTAYASLQKGDVNATIIHQPFATIAEQDGNHILGKTWEYMPDYNTGVLVASDDFIKNKPDVLKRVLEIYYYANEWCRTHFDTFIPWAAAYLNLDEDTALKVFNSEIELWENDPVVIPERLQKTEDLLAEYGMQDKSLPVQDVYDNTIADEVASELKLGTYRTTPLAGASARTDAGSSRADSARKGA